MGYEVRIIEGGIVIPNETKPAILERWKLINQPEFNKLKNGGSWQGGKQTACWYSWMDENYDKKVQSVEDVLSMLGFEFEVHEDKTVVNGYDQKTGQEDLFFSAIHKWVYGEVTWMGEDYEKYRWSFPIENYDPIDACKLAGPAGFAEPCFQIEHDA